MQPHCIDKQIGLRRDCIYNIENTNLEIGVLSICLYLLQCFEMHKRSCLLRFNRLIQRSLLRGRGTSIVVKLAFYGWGSDDVNIILFNVLCHIGQPNQ